MQRRIDEPTRQEAIRLLNSLLTPRQMRESIRRDVESLVARSENRKGIYSSRIDDRYLAEFLVDLEGLDLLSNRELRQALVDNASNDQIVALYTYINTKEFPDRLDRATKIVERRWWPGRTWAHHFARTFGFPLIFAGIPGEPEGPAVEEIEPHVPLPPLHDFQQELFNKLTYWLDSETGPKRALLSLPTGAGKTRTTVEGVITWWNSSPRARPLILWIAQSDELCEQALEAFREVWINRGSAGERQSLRLYRCWGSRKALPGLYATGVVIASIQKLDEIVRQGMDDELTELAQNLGIVIVDEAHHGISTSYTGVLRALRVLSVPSTDESVPLLGLTATPYRGLNEDENKRLVTRFKNLLISELLGDDPITELRDRGVLAHVKHQEIETGRRFELTKREYELYQQMKSLPSSFVRKVGDDPDRNHLLLIKMMELPSNWPILFFGCSVEHASAIAVMLRRKGITAAVVTGETRRATRRKLIEEFRAGNVQVLCNYGVLTTGFDAPRIKAVVIARPTTSVVLYEQMIGRGMRGPLNGGTESCVVVDVVDNIRRFGGQMAYARMRQNWG